MDPISRVCCEEDVGPNVVWQWFLVHNWSQQLSIIRSTFYCNRNVRERYYMQCDDGGRELGSRVTSRWVLAQLSVLVVLVRDDNRCPVKRAEGSQYVLEHLSGRYGLRWFVRTYLAGFAWMREKRWRTSGRVCRGSGY